MFTPVGSLFICLHHDYTEGESAWWLRCSRSVLEVAGPVPVASIEWRNVMKLKWIFSVALIFLFALFCTTTAFATNVAAADLTPYNLAAVLIPEDGTHPYGSAALTFKINNLPGDTGDTTLTWYVNIDKKIGQNEWIGVEAIPSATVLEFYATGEDQYRFEQLWVEDYEWDGSSPVSYRVSVVLEDLVGNGGGASEYSNVATIGLLSSGWAKPELEKAQGYGLIPDILIGKDLSKPITREEFCELAVLLYEQVTGKTPVAASPNPFTDTTNPRVLMAYKLGITTGISTTKFEPVRLIDREQCATMLFRAIKAIAPTGNYSAPNAKPFPDQKLISTWALDAAKYMAQQGIIRGDAAGNFMPKATATAQTAANYGRATREAAIIMASRTYEGMENGMGDSGMAPGAGNTTPAPSGSGAAAQNSSLVGLWSQDGPTGTLVDPATGYTTGSVYNGEWYLFRDDGTYRYVLVGSGSIISGGVVHEGRYEVSGNQILLKSTLVSWYPNPAKTGQSASYENKPEADKTVTYELMENGTKITIDGDTFFLS